MNGSTVSASKTGPALGADVALPWLLRLRWGYVLCQALVIGFVSLAFHLRIPVLLVILLLVFEILSNVAMEICRARSGCITSRTTVVLFFLDAVFLTVLLFATGGALNPFTFLYLVHIVLAAIILPVRQAWLLWLWTSCCYLLLFIPVSETLIPLPGADYILTGPICPMVTDASGPLKLHLQGMWGAFTVTAAFIVHFAGRIQAALREQQQTEQALEAERLRSERLASLTGLAASAAHELSTPLATIAVAAGELEEDLRQEEGSGQARADLALIRDQVRHCKEILYDMAAGAGSHRGEPIGQVVFADLLAEVKGAFSAAEQHRLQVESHCNGQVYALPQRTFCRTMAALIRNGLQATEPAGMVRVRCFEKDGFLVLSVSDSGPGMDEETRARAAEPFFTTRDSGMGLGLFLARTMAERFDGFLDIDSRPGEGTTVYLRLALKDIG